MDYYLSKDDVGSYIIKDAAGESAARLIKRSAYEDRKHKTSWMLVENGKLLRATPFIDKGEALDFYKDLKSPRD